MDILGFILGSAIYVFLAHLIAKRGFRTGLYYNRVFVIALFFMLPAFLWVYLFRNPRKGIYYERIPPE